ncbi:MAG: AI-2E family transporter [Anaerolineae bacterium]|jgi:predicted PurR-regulated permease PerM|nr:AI-2E family transporter [Anaerolineae bacterium]MBT7073839.1 AI-2E family transporter [Anaerolineae bacterium]MBT7782822.1 AI-2E family transporter [Anaerolineae bacterium]
MAQSNSTTSPRWGVMTKSIITVIIIIITAALLLRFKQLIIPLAISFILAYLFQPIASLLDRAPRLSWRMSVGITYLFFILLFISLFTLGGLGIGSQTQSLISLLQDNLNEIPSLITEAAKWLSEKSPVPIDLSTLNLESISEELLSYIQPVLGSTGQVLGSVATGAASFFGMTAFVVLVSYFILGESGGLRENLLKFEVPGYVEDFKRLSQELGRIWNAFLRGQMIVFTLAFIFYLIVLSVLGVRYAIGLALLAGISKFLPYIGPAMVWVALALVSYFQTFKLFDMDPFAYSATVIILALIFDQILDGFITPRIMADALSVHPAAVLVAALVFADLMGILGIIIAAPMLATFILIGRYIMRKMLDENPWKNLDAAKRPPSSLKLLDAVRSFFNRVASKKKTPTLPDTDTPPASQEK